MSGWRFSVAGNDCWRDAIDAAPTNETRRLFWDLAVPRLAAHDGAPPSEPCIVVCHVSAPAHRGQAPAGPLARAKALLDALHDDRRSGPRYGDLGARPPISDDDPRSVAGLAVEVAPGDPRVEYELGADLTVDGQLLAAVPVSLDAPNDVVGTSQEKVRIVADRCAYGLEVRRAFASCRASSGDGPRALVIRHRPMRDEDNTWATWIAAVCGVRGDHDEHWSTGAPLAGWVPAAVASVADASLETQVVYELWG